MATSINLATFRIKLGECADAIEASNWVLATTKYAAAEAIFAGLESEMSDQDSSLKYRQNLESLKKAIDAAKSITAEESTGGIGILYPDRPCQM